LFASAYVDLDEWRDEPVRHRYVHGGFEETETRFSYYFPPVELYEGRFFHPLFAASGSEHGVTSAGVVARAGSIEFAAASGGYLVESNQGRTTPTSDPQDPSIQSYRASAASAQYSRLLAAEMYGDHRPYGYVFGGSGGAWRTMSCIENTMGVWDGAMPYVHGGVLWSSLHSAVTHAARLLRPKAALIADAVEPGGSGDLFAGLNVEEREALALLLSRGFPPRDFYAFDDVARFHTWIFTVFAEWISELDPEYFEDFWTKPGYLGADAPNSLTAARVQYKTTVSKVVTAAEAAALNLPEGTIVRMLAEMHGKSALRIEGLPSDPPPYGATLTVTSGLAAGRSLFITDVVDDDIVLVGETQTHAYGLSDIEAGDEVLIDNSDFLAFQTYHRHQADPRYRDWWEQALFSSGQPIYPQRPRPVDPELLRRRDAGARNGRFVGKMIVVQALMDEVALPTFAVYYRSLVEAALGPRLDDQYRLWFVDHAMHGPDGPATRPSTSRPARKTRIIDFTGFLQQTLRDLAAWVEHGLAPPASTVFDHVEGQVSVAPTATARKGIQPVVTVTANGSARADVSVGDSVAFRALVEVPPGGGTLVAAEWDFEGAGDFPVVESGMDGAASRLRLEQSYAFIAPGTYFPALRVVSQRQGDTNTPFGRVENLGRVRVVVH
jgi:hypothetical protein